MKWMKMWTTITLALLLIWPGAAGALEPDEKCQSLKNKDTGKLASCLQSAEAKLVTTEGACSLTGTAECYRDDDCPVSETCVKDLSRYNGYIAKCSERFFNKWEKDETRGEGQCPDGIADPNSMLDFVADHSNAVSRWLTGAGLPPVCGNRVIETGEDCEFGDLNGEDCNSQTSGAQPVGDLACTAGTCTFDTTGCVARFVDNGNGTITDNLTKLMWEKKSDDGSIHDWNSTYTWRVTGWPYPPDGTLFTQLQATLNTNPCFAGYCDWRVPSLAELQTIVDSGAINPATYPEFNTGCAPDCTVDGVGGPMCSCTRTGGYWSASTLASSPDMAWIVIFYSAYLDYGVKTSSFYARAVRGDL